MKVNIPVSQQKLVVQLRKLADTDLFQNTVLKLRAELMIPRNGCEITEADLMDVGNPFHIPQKVSGIIPFSRKEFSERLIQGILPLIDKLAVPGVFHSILLKNYVCFNDFLFEQAIHNFPQSKFIGLCELVDARFEFEHFDVVPKNDCEFCKETSLLTTDILNKYPITIRISSDASQRDVIDFLKDNSKMFDAIKARYDDDNDRPTVRNGKKKINEDKHTRDEFIYENRSLSRKKIANLLAKKNIFLDIGSIGKIISLQKQKREKK